MPRPPPRSTLFPTRRSSDLHQDEPLADPVCVPLHAVSEAARLSGTKVVQVGEGSDELFAGYSSYAFFSDFHRRIRSEEHTSELQSHSDLVCRLLLEKKKKIK